MRWVGIRGGIRIREKVNWESDDFKIGYFETKNDLLGWILQSSYELFQHNGRADWIADSCAVPGPYFRDVPPWLSKENT
jgi:hypothetical protein